MAKRLGSIGAVLKAVKGKEDSTEPPRKNLRDFPKEFEEEIEWD